MEFTYKSDTWYQETFENQATGTRNCYAGEYNFEPAASTNFVLALPIKFNLIKVSAKGTGDTTDSALQLYAVLT